MATEEIQFLDDELLAIYTEIRTGIEQLSVMQGAADKKLDKYSFLTQRVSRARTAYQSFKVELRELRDEEKKIWTAVSAPPHPTATVFRPYENIYSNLICHRKTRSTIRLSRS